jgi:hypothetical protein
MPFGAPPADESIRWRVAEAVDLPANKPFLVVPFASGCIRFAAA